MTNQPNTTEAPAVWVVELDNREDNDTTGLVGVFASRDRALLAVTESALECLDEPALVVQTGLDGSTEVEDESGSLFYSVYKAEVLD